MAVWLYVKKQYYAMIAALIVSVLVKQSAAVAIIAILILSTIRIASRRDLQWVPLLLIPMSLAFASQFFSLIEPKELSVSEMTMSVSDWILKPSAVIERIGTLLALVPDQTVLLLLSAIAGCVYGIVVLILLAWRFIDKRIQKISDLQAFVSQRELPLLCAAVIIGFTILYYSINIILPRYSIWVFPFELIFAACFLRKTPRFLAILSVLLIGLNIVNHCGYVYRLISPAPLHGFAMYLERSMEYRDDLICNQRMALSAEKQLQECDIVTCWPFAHMLAAPEFGYVKKPLSVVSVNMQGLPALKVPHVSTWIQNRGTPPRPVVFISTISNFFMPMQFNPQAHRMVEEIS